MRKLSLKALVCMEGQLVRVHDLAYDEYDQICEIKLKRDVFINKKGKKKYEEKIVKLWLENEEFIFEYDGNTCVNGEFEVFSLS